MAETEGRPACRQARADHRGDQRARSDWPKTAATSFLNGLGDPDEIEALRGGLEARFGIRALYHGADLADPSAIAAMMDHVAAVLGGVDILVNNAVVRHFAPVDAFPVERWDEALAVNLSAAFHTIRLAVPEMRRRNWRIRS